MAQSGFRVGGWLVQPSLDRLQLAHRTVHLRPKTMQVLVALAEHPGEVVTREYLYSRIWADVHVSAEGLNHCIAELRAAFGDAVHSPQFVETVAKHGYRLVAPVDLVEQPASSEPPPVPADQAPRPSSAPSRPARQVRLRWAVALGTPVIAVVLLVLTAVVGVSHRDEARSPVQLNVLLADWKNGTGDAAFAVTLRHALAIRLGESPVVRVLPSERVASALQWMRRPVTTPVVDATARDVCTRLGGDVVIDSEITGLGTRFVIMLEARGCGGDRQVLPVRVEAKNREAVLAAVDRAAAGLLEQLRYVRPRNAAQPRPDEEVTTAEPEALWVYWKAGEALARRSVGDAIRLYEHAVEIDPNFALAHSRLATTLASIREWKHANEHRDRALAGLNGLTEREQLYVKAAHELGHGRYGEAESQLTTWSLLYPEDRVPLGWLAIGCVNRGERARALHWNESAAKADSAPVALSTLAAVELSLGRLNEADAIATRASDSGLLFVLAFLRRDGSAMQQLANSVTADSFEELDMRARQAQAAAAAGHLREARMLVGDAEKIGLQLGLRELTAQVLATQAVWESELSEGRLGADWALASLSLDDNSTTEALAVLVFARAGATGRAEELLKQIPAPDPTVDLAVVMGSKKKLRAAIDLARGRNDLALEDLNALGNYEYGGAVNLIALRGDIAELGVFHLRGLAFLALGQGEKAAAEFQRIIDNQSISPLSPYAALAPLNLARALTLAGKRPEALNAYEQFLRRWQGADAEVGLVAKASREYAALAATAPTQSAR
jgi:DNA-binding winged helix-turn-helix (wHTH) protein/tetratricopeptide (TPR) repeat protein